jgi:hypothetical protein
MLNEIPAWMQSASKRAVGQGIRKPKPIKASQSTMPAQASAVQAQALRTQTAAQSHNVFRPDIFRVSEGYLN